MSKSFSIDLTHYKLCRTMGGSRNTLRTSVDRSDLINCLESLGYFRVNEISFGNQRFGNIDGFESILQQYTLGIPTTAHIEITRLGAHGNIFHLNFTY